MGKLEKIFWDYHALFGIGLSNIIFLAYKILNILINKLLKMKNLFLNNT